MKLIRIFLFFIFFTSTSIFSQEKFTKHTVSNGESVSEIAKKYHIKPEAIYELNPDAINGIKKNTVLLIPSTASAKTSIPPVAPSNPSENAHQVLPKETIYGISKQYHIAVADLYKANPKLETEGLKIGQTILIPLPASDKMTSTVVKDNKTPISLENKSPKKEVQVVTTLVENKEIPTQGIIREVLPKETLYSIAKQYGIKVADIQKANPSLENGALKTGQKIVIPVKSDVNSNTIPEKKESIAVKENPILKPAVVENTIHVSETVHEVLPKETYYSISKLYKISVSDLQKANTQLGNKALKAGQKIVIPKQMERSSSAESVSKELKTGNLSSNQPSVESAAALNDYTREVLPKETKYGIAKEYGITVAELEKQNPSIAKKLIIGSNLKIRTSKVMEAPKAVEEIAVKEEGVKTEIEVVTNPVYSEDLVEQLIQTASENIGTRYRSGGITKEGFDCSGLMCYTFNNCDIKLPRSSAEMASYGTKINTEAAQKGDLIFFKTRGSGRINHVGMVVEVLDGEIKFIHSATHGGVIISSTKESYYQRNFAQVNRVL